MRSCISIWKTAIILMGLSLFLSEERAIAQTETGSPYTVKGLGELHPRNYARNFGMGGVGIALPGVSGVDPSNPGHYGNLVEPGFDMGVTHDRITVSDGEIAETKKRTQLQNVAFGFPGSKRWTLTLGIHPFAQRDYDVEDTLTKPGVGEFARSYTGEGRIHKLYIGNGYNILHQGDSLRLGIGFNLSYLFGELTQRKSTEYRDPANFNTRIRREAALNAFAFDAGLHFQKRFGLHPRDGAEEGEMVPLRLMAGLTVDIPRNVQLEMSEVGETYTSSGTRDTSSFVEDEGVPFQLPLGYGGGISFEYDEKLTGSFEYRTRQWGSVGEEASALLFPGDRARDREILRAGFEFTPRTEYARTSSYFAYMNYRLGVRSISEYYRYNGREVRDLGISFGLGLPLVRSSSFSTLDIGVEWSKRGPGGGGSLLRERAWKFYLGVSLSPHRADQWFREPKIR
jgi:hypothetical protein